MIFVVDAGKLKILFDDPDINIRLQQLQLLISAIGSAHPMDEERITGVSCALSVANLRKLKHLFPDTKRSTDDLTNEAITHLRAEQDAFEAESALGDRIKAEGPVLPEDYTFKVKPFKHQILGFRFVRELPRPALFGDCGTGKTFIVSTVVDSMVKRGDKVITLVLCPVNLINGVWLDELAKFTDLSAVSLRVEHSNKVKKKEMRDAAFAADVDVYMVNPENARAANKDKGKQVDVMALLRRRRKQGYKVFLVIDESSKIKSKESATYRAITAFRSLCEKCVIMTGTPAPNGVKDLWPQFHVLDHGKTLEPSYTDFRHATHNLVTYQGVKWLDKGGKEHNATKWAEKKGIGPAVYQRIKSRMIRFRLDDCVDLPPRRFLQRDVFMSDEQTRVYKEMEERLFAELEDGTVTARVAAAKMMKLREVTGGFVIDDRGVETAIGTVAPKMVELDEMLTQSIADKMGDEGPPLKAIVWAQYQWECKNLVARYKAQYQARGLFGGISSSAKDDAIRRFKADPAARLLICHPQSVGHGLTLVEASYAFYYSLSYNYEELYQSTRRIIRAGQKRPTTTYFLVTPGTIDQDIMDAIADKKDLSDMITDGKFNRGDFIARRSKSHKQLRIEWEGPDDLQPAPPGS